MFSRAAAEPAVISTVNAGEWNLNACGLSVLFYVRYFIFYPTKTYHQKLAHVCCYLCDWTNQFYKAQFHVLLRV